MKDKFEILEKYNFWRGKTLNPGFARTAYLDKLSASSGNKLIKVIVGQRRIGKSYILRQMAQRLLDDGVRPQNIFYLNKEFTDFDFVEKYQDLAALVDIYKKRLKPRGKIYLFLDEIQNITGWERFVNSCAQDFTEHYELFISGSNSRMLSGELATFLSGRYVQVEILPFSFREYAGILREKINKTGYLQYIASSALPEMFALPDQETKRNYISAVKDTILLRDIIQRHNIKEPRLLEDIFVYLVNNTAKLMSINNIVNFFKSRRRKTTYDTIANYIRYIEETFLVHKAERYNIRGKETIAGNCKYYLNDLAFKNYLYSGFGQGIGYQLENLVYLELRRAGYSVYTGVVPGKEVDFVARRGDRLLYLQSAYLLPDAQTVEREYSALEAIRDNHEKYVVSLDDIAFASRRGIKHLQAWKLAELL
jgi:predicted AAA+ superfamily ATPase